MSKTKKLRKAQERQKNQKKVPDRSHGNKFFVAATAVVAVVIITVVCVEQLSRKLAAEVGEKKIYQDEMMYYVQQEEQEVSSMSYDAVYRQSLGVPYWSDGGGRERSQTSIEEDMVMDEILSQEAEAKKVSLTEEEADAAEEEAKTAFDAVPSSVRFQYGVTLDKYKNICKKHALADKYKEELIDGFDIDVEAIKADIDYEIYRQYDVIYYFMPVDAEEETGKSEDEIKAEKENAKKALLDLKTRIDAGAEFKSFAETASKAGITVRVEDTIGLTGIHPIIGDDVLDDAIDEIGKLSKDEVSDVIETDAGYYLFQMVDNDSSEAYDEEVESRISEENESQFEIEYNDVLFPKYKVQIKTDLWDNIKLGTLFTQS